MGLLATPWHQALRPEKPASEPLLVVHAGTHKTASSYLQNRLENNAAILQSLGIYMAWPGRPGRKHKGLVEAMLEAKTKPWERYLASAFPGARQWVVTAEQFTPAITEPQQLAFLAGVARRQGMTLRLLLFLRDQPDLLNSLYAHTVRRLYHHQEFSNYVHRALGGGSWFVSYHNWLAAARLHPSIELVLLPYHFQLEDPTGNADPFNRMAQALGWRIPGQGWQPASRRQINTQVGRKGILLAMEISKALSCRGIEPRSVRNTGGVIRAIAEREGWAQDRFQGFEPSAYCAVRETLKASNDLLAQAAWGVPWAEVFPATPQEQSIATAPENPQEAQYMKACLEEALEQLLNQSP